MDPHIEKTWIWSVNKENWPVVLQKKKWAVDSKKKTGAVRKGDIIVFYVTGTHYYQGVFRAVSDWRDSTLEWPDGRAVVSEVDLEEVETGYADIRKTSDGLEFVKNPSKIGSYLKGMLNGPSNFSRPISEADLGLIRKTMRENQAPPPISQQQVPYDVPEEYDSSLKKSPVRLQLIKSIFENLMGPKNGPGETIEDVGQAYVVGVLRTDFAPSLMIEQDPADTVVPRDQRDSADVTNNDDEDKVPADSDLNPMRGVRSIGLSFIVSGDSPKMRICATWGRYAKISASNRLYRREMNYCVTDVNIGAKPNQAIKPEDPAIKQKRITKPGVELRVMTKSLDSGAFHVSVFMINYTPYDTDGFQTAQEAVYQPQIRINLHGGSSLQDLGRTEGGADADGIRSDLFANRRSLGKGHFCGVQWKDVDPEDIDGEGFSTFNWPDSRSKFFGEELRREFTRPDIRTEFFPTYSILQPDTSEISHTRFSSGELSDMWDPDRLSRKLTVLVERYREWIDEREAADPATDLAECRRCADRIEGGIRLLSDNEHARLAFCFMNKAIDTKAKWDGMDNFEWWEFQMAFILQCIGGVALPDSEERDLCDILWFPTGGGKTEAYMGLTVFSIIYRRLQEDDGFSADGGVSVISRYTLRLLTIQQFQRALGAIVASDLLRTSGWIPSGASLSSGRLKDRMESGTLWGQSRISIGLFIGGSATPNRFHDRRHDLQAEGMLLCKASNKESGGEPAQILNCPCCSSILAVPTSDSAGLDEKTRTIHWVFSSISGLDELRRIPASAFSGGDFEATRVELQKIGDNSAARGAKYFGIRVDFKRRRNTVISASKIRSWWNDHVCSALSSGRDGIVNLASTDPTRPGYFFVREGRSREDFGIFCPNPDCALNRERSWHEGEHGPRSPVPEPFRISGRHNHALFFPISAYTVDEQIFRRCPTLLISTVDKFAMMPFFKDFSSIFGNVDEYHPIKGYGRADVTDYRYEDAGMDTIPVRPFLPPSLIIQDELHLIEGPMGSMVGAYEIAVDVLCTTGRHRPKYIASSATIREAESQVGTVFRRPAAIFPPQAGTTDDSYFSRSDEDRRSNSDKPGRVYLGVCAPQKILTVPVKIWSCLLSETYRARTAPHEYGLDAEYEEYVKENPESSLEEFVKEKTDGYWTLVGYFNAIKELQIARSLYDDDIQRDVKQLSAVSEYSARHQTGITGFEPGLRYFPVMTENDIDVSGITVFCGNTRGSINVAVFENTDSMRPGKIIGEAKRGVKKCVKGGNEFVLNEPVGMKGGEIVWIGVANDKKSTLFETGPGDLEPLFCVTTPEQLAGIFDQGDFPAGCRTVVEKATIRLSLHSESRQLNPEPVELTGNTESQELPNVLKMIQKKPDNDVDCVFTTAVFGTGIDIPRLGLMTVMGQPKTTSAYIQATGRVGRNTPGLVVTWLKATNIRDLNHYENFVGYHRMLHKFVEPISASPFAEESMRLCLGPVLVSILRNGRRVAGRSIPKEWVGNETAPARMGDHSRDEEVEAVCSEIKKRLSDVNIPPARRPDEEIASVRVDNTVTGWNKTVRNLSRENKALRYLEWTINSIPQHDVVLGSPQHEMRRKTTVFKNTRTSMRQVETTASFEGY